MPTLKMVRPRRIATMFFLVVVFLFCSLPSWSQGWPLPLGDLSDIPQPTGDCSDPIYLGKLGTSPPSSAKCGVATVTGCLDSNGVALPPVDAYLAWSKPSGAIAGTIVIFNGGAGTDWFGVGLNNVTYVKKYVDNNFQVIQVMWRWQPTNQTWRDNLDHPLVKNLKVEGCRPATLLRRLYQAPWGHNWGTGFTKGMCAQGHSTGATAIAYALAWYGAGSDVPPATGYLDNVVLTSGPAQGDLQLGCKYDGSTPSPITVCPQSQNKCGNAPSWFDCAQYDNGSGLDCMNRAVDGKDAAVSVAQFTFTTSPTANCNNTNDSGIATTLFQNSKWQIMSVVSTGAHYDYPRTSVSAFLCASGVGQYEDLPNNSAAQAWQYLQYIQDGPLINVYPVEQCQGTEEIWGPDAKVYGGGAFGFDVSSDNMIDDCIKRH